MESPEVVIKKIQESAKWVSVDVGTSFFKTPDLEVIEDERCLSILLSDPTEKYCASSDIKGDQISFSIKVLFSLQTARNLLKNKFPNMSGIDEKDVVLDILKEYVNIFNGAFKLLFKYPEKFNFSMSAPTIATALSTVFEPSALISRWFIASNEKEIILQPFLFYKTISNDVFKNIVLHELGYKESDNIEILS
ncbi:MAG: hypothetical protein HQK54_12845 [Oligoflexales bacterium]|nr:hypothetical protein [Oligoflexales bacterium]